jgi:phage terminase large subunit-like protein
MTRKRLDGIDSAVQQRGLIDPFFFIRDILGYKDITENLHGEMIDFVLSHEGEECSALIPRFHFKTSVISVGLSLWKIVKNPNIRILIVNKIMGNAVKIAVEIRTHFERNKRLIRYYGDFVSKTNWNDSAFTVSKRKVIKKESTVTIGATGHELTSGHYDWIIPDDIVGLKDQISDAERTRSLDFYKSLKYLQDKGTTITNLGTRWHTDDLYSFQFKHLPPSAIYLRKALLDGDVPLFKERFTREDLVKLREEDPILFSAQMMNEPLPFGSKIYSFDELKFQPFDSWKVKDFAVYGWCDLAYTEQKKNDATAIAFIGIDKNGISYVLECFQDRILSDESEVRVVDGMRRYQENLVMFGGEDNGGQSIFYKNVKKRTALELPGMDSRIRTRNEIQNKVLKLQLARDTIVNKTIFRDDWQTAYPELIRQIINCPTKNDDSFDALVGAQSLVERKAEIQLWNAPEPEKKPLIQKYKYRQKDFLT